jgi:hypothetical protein
MDIFRRVDTVDFDPANEEELFLLAYWALLREQHGPRRFEADPIRQIERIRQKGHRHRPRSHSRMAGSAGGA